MPPSSHLDVHIWFQDTKSLDHEAMALAGQVLSQEELIQRDRFRFHEDQCDYAVAHSLLRQSLSKHAPGRSPSEWHFKKNAYGKPYVVGGEDDASIVEFSLSHTRGFVANAISLARVGIDVERVRSNIDYEDIAKSSFAHQEIEALEQLPASARSARVLQLWTLKEAFLKAIGRGLSAGLDFAWFELLPSGAIRFHADESVDTHAWKFALFAPQPDAWLGVAVESRGFPRIFLQGEEVSAPHDADGIALTLRWRSFAEA